MGAPRAVDIIRAKRDGETLSEAALAAFVEGYTRGDIPDYQAAAFVMAVYFQGMVPEELAAWTRLMLHSGEVLDLGEIPGRKVDKHSTGGVGDKISLPLAPIVAACGVRVPMVSGRGLGHTGGTLDKLESIPGFRVDLPVARYRELVAELGTCLIGQTAEIAPADRKLYALRDVTATVESVPLISSSILSKKLAEGIDALVLDVKVGRGAFMRRLEDARVLAETMVGLGRAMGKEVVALLTDMDAPLGRAVGNALEVRESIALLRGEAPVDLNEITLALAAEMLVLGHVAPDLEAGRAQALEAIESGRALALFRALVEAQGGDPAAIDDPDRLPTARKVVPVLAPRAGVVQAIDALEVGLAAMRLGAGRATKEAEVDPAVGVWIHAQRGERVEAGAPLCELHVNDEAALPEALAALEAAFTLGDAAPTIGPAVIERVGA